MIHHYQWQQPQTLPSTLQQKLHIFEKQKEQDDPKEKEPVEKEIIRKKGRPKKL